MGKRVNWAAVAASALQLAATGFLLAALLSNTWTELEVGVVLHGNHSTTFNLRYSLTRYCVEFGDGEAHCAAYMQRHNAQMIPLRLTEPELAWTRQDVDSLWCPSTQSPSSLVSWINSSAANVMCLAFIDSCFYLLLLGVHASVVLVGAVIISYSICTSEALLGRCTQVLSLLTSALALMIAILWSVYNSSYIAAAPLSPSITVKHKSLGAGFASTIVAVVLLFVSFWSNRCLTRTQQRNHINHDVLQSSKRNPLDCPAIYA